MRQRIVFPLVLLTLWGCEKEIAINVDDSDSRIVIEGRVSTIADESTVTLTQSINLDDLLPYPTISGASVSILNQTSGATITLSETEAGVYTSTQLLGSENTTYQLSVVHDNITYTAQSTLPNAVSLEGLEQIGGLSSEGGGGGPNGGGPDDDAESFAEIRPIYNDPIDEDNWYQFIVVRNGEVANDIFIFSDFAFNGVENSRSLNIEAEAGDTITITMQCIDEAVFDYLLGLNENINQSSATPANPISNLSNGALGYFKAHTSSTQTIVVTDDAQ